jgi:hypothetical protein
LRVHIRGIEKIDSRFQADVDEMRRFLYIGLTPCPEELVSSTKGGSAKAENRNLQAALS